MTGVGTPPWTWPVDGQIIVLRHKAVYAFAAGAVVDHLVEHAGSAGELPAPRHSDGALPDDGRKTTNPGQTDGWDGPCPGQAPGPAAGTGFPTQLSAAEQTR